MAHRYLTSRDVENHLRNKEGIEARSTVSFGKIRYFILKGDKSSNTTCKNNTGTINIDIVFADTCIFHCFITCNQRSLRKPVNLSCFLLLKKIEWVEVLYFTG